MSNGVNEGRCSMGAGFRLCSQSFLIRNQTENITMPDYTN